MRMDRQAKERLRRQLLSISRWDQLSRRHDADSRMLAKNQRLMGAIYLKGYAVECALKMLIIAKENLMAQRGKTLTSDIEQCFSGTLGHDLLFLFNKAFSDRNPSKLRVKVELMQFSAKWSVELRYSTSIFNKQDAHAILNFGDRIISLCRQEGQ